MSCRVEVPWPGVPKGLLLTQGLFKVRPGGPWGLWDEAWRWPLGAPKARLLTKWVSEVLKPNHAKYRWWLFKFFF